MNKLLIMIFVLLVGTRACMASVLFEDTFDNTNSLNNWDVVTGDWKVNLGELYGQGAGPNIDAWIYAGDTSWTDFTYETTARLIDGNADLVFRSTGHWQNEYRLILFSNESSIYTNSFKFLKYSDNGGKLFSEGVMKPTTVPITAISDIKVIAMGNTFQGFVNNQKLFEYTDDNPLTNGRIGLGVVWNFQGSFDNVRVSGNPTVTPEPVSMALFALGGGVMALWRRQSKSRYIS